MKNTTEKQKKLSLMQAFPSLAKEWHSEKNKTLTPEDVTPDDVIHAWWQCNLKHEYSAAVKDRVDGAGCPLCPSITKPFPGMITLAEDEPEAIKFWHPTKNGNRTPHDFSKQAGTKVWWKCEKGHEWYATISSMRYKPRCRICYPGIGTSEHYNLAVKRPELADQWHPTKNGTFLPTQITPYSCINVWWKCSKGHEWQATPASRRNQQGCPHCSRKQLSSTYNLAITSPHIVPFWHPTKNEGRTPADFMPNYDEKMWWICEKGHEWERSIGYMKYYQTCPVCRQTYIDETKNLQVKNPQLAREWHPVKNGDLTPDKVRAHTPLKVWWLCPRGHEYQATVGNRNRAVKGRGCPICSGRKDLSKESFAVLMPELAKEWHPEKNGTLTPEKVSTINKRLVWWRCKKGHEWVTSVDNRVQGKKKHKCPHCEAPG